MRGVSKMLQCCGCNHGNNARFYSNLDEVVVGVRPVSVGPRNAIRQTRRVSEVY